MKSLTEKLRKYLEIQTQLENAPEEDNLQNNSINFVLISWITTFLKIKLLQIRKGS